MITETTEEHATPQELPAMEGEGVARKTIPEIEELAGRYVTARNKRQEDLRQEVILKRELIAMLKTHDELKNNAGDYVYEFADDVVILSRGKEKLKVESAFAQDDENEED